MLSRNSSEPKIYDAVVIGGGFYGSAIAVYLAKERGFRNIMLIERERALLTRASYNNQARVHNGYHYPRSFTTAYRSRINLPKFVKHWPEAVSQDLTKLYAIARRNSRVTAAQFDRFCRDIGAKIQRAEPSLRKLFEPHLIEEVFLVEELAFNSTKLAAWCIRELDEARVQIRYRNVAEEISRHDEKLLRVVVTEQGGMPEQLLSHNVFNCTYSGLNQFKGGFPGIRTELKQEITEMGLMRMPPALEKIGVTLMDGPFFSIMPFPARGLHTLSHVRYTPHLHWADSQNIPPYSKLSRYERTSRVDRMVRDAGRYIPEILKSEHVDSLFEIKTVLSKNEGDDGRPILFEKYLEMPGCYSVLGGKIDNIYDVLEKLDKEVFLTSELEPNRREQ